MTSTPLPPSPPPSVPPATGEQPSAGTGPTGRPHLRRSGNDRMAGGVCGGLADYSGIDALLWRVGFVGLTVAGGSGIVVYLLLWLLLPSGPFPPGSAPSPAERLVQRLHAALSEALASTRHR